MVHELRVSHAIGFVLMLSSHIAKDMYRSFWGDIFQVGMQDPPTKTDGSASRQVVFQPAGEHAVEGAYVFVNNGMYYMFYSAGKCCGLDKNRPPAGQEYKIMVCRSNSPTGPYVRSAL